MTRFSKQSRKSSSKTRRLRLTVSELEAREVPAGLAYDGDTIIVRFAADAARPSEGTRSLGGNGLYSVRVPDGRTVAQTVAEYSVKKGVMYAEPNFLLAGNTGPTVLRSIEIPAASRGPRDSVGPNDPLYTDGTLWGLHNTGQNGGVADADIDAPEGWAVRTSADGLVIGVIDSGIDYTHPDLVNNLWRNPGETPDDGLDNDSNGYVDDYFGYDFINGDSDPMDDFGHGTVVSGVIAAQGDNGQGVTGVVQSGARLMALKMIDANTTTTAAAAIEAINYSVMMGVTLTNNSWYISEQSKAMADAIVAAGEAGQLFVASTLNLFSNNETFRDDPATSPLPNLVTIGALTRTGDRAVFSNFGRNVDLMAPGLDITTTATSFPNAPISNGTPYGEVSGASLAAPYVTGALALLKAEFPMETPVQLKARLMAESVPLPGSAPFTASGGTLNLGSLLNPAARVVKLATVESADGKVAKLRLTFSESMDLATMKQSAIRVTKALGGLIAVRKVEAVDAANSIFEVTIRPQHLANGGLRLKLSPTVKSAAGGFLDQDHDGTGGEAADTFHGAVVRVTTTGGAIAGNDANDFRMLIPAGLVMTATDVDVRADIDYPAIGELLLEVINPYGQTVSLAEERGVYADGFVNTIFDDDAQTHLRDGLSNYAGVFQSDGILNAFRGTAASGDWVIRAMDTDDATASVGQVKSLTLTVAGIGHVGHLAAIASVLDESGSTLAPRPAGFELAFNAAVNLQTLSIKDFRVTGPHGENVPILSVGPVAGKGDQVFRIKTALLDRSGNYTLVVGSRIVGTFGQKLDGDGDNRAGEKADGFAATFAVRDSIFTMDQPVQLKDDGITVSTIEVGSNITIDQIAVDLTIRSAYSPAYTITLMSPTGQAFILFDQDGGTFAGVANLTRTIFSDAAENTLDDASPPYRGEFKPRESLAALSGTSAEGVWTLTVQNHFPDETGHLQAWGIHVTPSAGSGT